MAAAAAAWAVRATKKGDLPISVEKRGQHKVTVVRNVERPELLSTALGKALGAGGSVSASGDVEVQGQLLPRVEAYLHSKPNQLRGLRRERPERTTSTAAGGAAAAASSRVERERADERRRAAGKARHVKAKTSTYVLAGADDDVVTATIRAAQAAGKCVGGWARCPHDWIYCTGRCSYPPSEDEDEKAEDNDDRAAGSCRDLVSAEEAWVVLPEERRRLAVREPEPEPELKGASLVRTSGSALDAALRSLGMLATSSAVDDRGKNRSERKVKVAERREERSAELQQARDTRAAERRSAAHSWWPAQLAAVAPAPAAAAPAWMRGSSSAGNSRRAPLATSSARAAQMAARPGATSQRSAKRQPQAKKRISSSGKGGKGGKGGGGGGGGARARGAGSGRARPLWEDELSSSTASRYEDDMSQDIDR
eukprot:COSAG06_NODE_1675_length_8744_cov_5.951764_2_plen_425_part_00